MEDTTLELIIRSNPKNKLSSLKAATHYNTPCYASETSVTRIYFVIVHQNQIDAEVRAGNLDFILAKKINDEIEGIKSRHPESWTRGSPFTVPLGIPKNRAILVCGAFESMCVSYQYDLLIKAGYKAYICRE